MAESPIRPFLDLLGPVLYGLIILQTILCLVLFFFLVVGFLCVVFFCSPSLPCLLDKNLIFLVSHIPPNLAFGRWERLHEPGLFLYVLPLVYVPRSEQAGHVFFFVCFFAFLL